MSAMEGGSPSKVEVDSMIEEFMEKKIDRRFEEHFAQKQAQLEANLGKILKAQTDRVTEAQGKVEEMYRAASEKFMKDEERINALFNDFNNTFNLHKGVIENLYERSETTAQSHNASLAAAEGQIIGIVDQVNKNKPES